MLKRDISTVNVLVAAAGGMIGSGWLFSPFISAQMAGSNALICWIIAAVFMLFIALPLCELGTMFPISGGMSNYPTFTHGREVGFIFGWVSWLSYVVMTPIEIQAILQYASHIFPLLVTKENNMTKLSEYGYLAAFIIMGVVVLLNTFGVKLLAECNKYASIIKFAIPSLAILSLLYTAHGAHTFGNVSIDLSGKQQWQSIFMALSLGGVAFGFTGFQNGLMLAGEVKNPERNIPIAILGAVLIGFILYFMLQLSFIAAVPKSLLTHGWSGLSFAGDSGPLVGLTLLLGLSVISILLMFDACFSPMGTTLVYTAATSRILYGMALNDHLPKFLLKLNKYQIPYVTLYINFAVGLLSFLPFPGWQKMVGFLSSASILSYGIGPICLLALRKLQPDMKRPFKLSGATGFSYIAFCVCNLMLYWCGFAILWKLYVAVVIGLGINLSYQKKSLFECSKSLYWFFSYLTGLVLLSCLGFFTGMIVVIPFSIVMLYLSQRCLDADPVKQNVIRDTEWAT
ncbi:MAG TPA: APC family permease [Gammaproteobacteria bacterium]|nr:APC family permease [Gammaproteobacteria bacterium]